MKSNAPPCIRGLKRFEKKGCPRKYFDQTDGSGCQAWIEMSVATRGNPLTKEVKKQCIDIWSWEFQWASLGLLEGNQAAIESFRNGMCEQTEDGKVMPKVDRATVELLRMLMPNQQLDGVIEMKLLPKGTKEH